MKRLFKIIIICFFFLIGMKGVYAENNVRIDTYSPPKNTVICLKSSKIPDNAHLYGWFAYDGSNSELAAWPGKPMSLTLNGIYCYTVQNGDRFDKVIFNNNNDIQTIDLSTIYSVVGEGDGRQPVNIITKYLYMFENDYIEGQGHKGEWYVYDNSSLSNLVDSTTSKINNRYLYTKSTYNTLKSAYNTSNGIINYSDPYSNSSPLIIHSDNGAYGRAVYTSQYIDAYNALVNANEGLKNRVPIYYENNISGGSVTASYTDKESDTNNKIEINPVAGIGHDIDSVKAYKVNEVINSSSYLLGDEITVTKSNDKYYTEFSDSAVSNSQGVYVDARFKKKIYRISFTIGENGKIIDKDSGNEIDVEDVIEVEYGSNFFAKLVANEGYELKSATVNNNEANIENNILKLEDINEDQNVVILFTIKSYTIKIDDVDYVFAYGTKYNEILSRIVTQKDGYTFVGLVDKNKNKITDDYVVTKDDVLYTVFKDNNDNNIINPDTGLYFLRIAVLVMIVGILLYFSRMVTKKANK